MKKILLALVLIVAGSLANAQFTKLGGGLDLGTGFYFNSEIGSNHRSGLLSLFVAGVYEFSLPVHISPSFSYTFPHVTKVELNGFSDKTTISSVYFNIDGHYVFNYLDKMELYGLGGMNVTLAKIKNEYSYIGEPGTEYGSSDNSIGLNIGAGAYFKVLEQGDIFAEVKYVLGKYDQLMIRGGILLNIDWLKKNE